MVPLGRILIRRHEFNNEWAVYFEHAGRQYVAFVLEAKNRFYAIRKIMYCDNNRRRNYDIEQRDEEYYQLNDMLIDYLKTEVWA